MRDTEDLKFYEMFSYSTTRIVCKLKNGGTSTGTGFFVFLNDLKNEDEAPKVAIITNKHVIRDAVEGVLTLTTKRNNKILNTEHFTFPHSNFESAWIPHPEENVDLCMLNFKPYELIFSGQNIELFYFPIPIHLAPDKEAILSFDALEDVIMIGYPNGIWDSYNNKPIFRKGVTATDYRLDYNNEPVFLIDIAVFGGSSGSPVLLSRIAYENIDGKKIPRRELYLMGVLYAGFQHTANGNIIIKEIPQLQEFYTETLIPNNLGLVIKSSKLMDFRKLFFT